MSVEPLAKTFNERLQEIEVYFDLLDALERRVREGPPDLGGSPITVQQQRILYASVYLQLYNLVEATATLCIEGVAAAAVRERAWQPGDLSVELRREWVRRIARTHEELNSENRLQAALKLAEWILEARPMQKWTVERSRSGNWDDHGLEAIAKRLGSQLQVSPEALRRIKQKIRDDKPPLVLVKDLRNRLAHGSLSFTECGENVTVADLRELKDRAASYLREVVDHFSGSLMVTTSSPLQSARWHEQRRDQLC